MTAAKKNTWALILAFLLLLAVCGIQAVISDNENQKPVHASMIPAAM